MTDVPAIAVRFALYLDLMLLCGLAGFAWGGGIRFRRLLPGLAVLGVLLSGVGLLVLAAAMAGIGISEVDRATLTMLLTGTAMGAAWLVRIAALVLAGGLALGGQVRASAVAGAIALATMAWTGHAVVDDGAIGWLHLGADIAHLIAAAWWLGALVALLALVSVRAARADAAHVATTCRALTGFATTGSVLVAVIVATGLLNSWLLVGRPAWPRLTGTLYGQLLLAKLALFVGMLALAAGNRFRLTPALEERRADPLPALRRLRASVAIETGCGVAILALVAWLGTLAPPVAGA